MKHIKQIDGLRFVAIFLVLVEHFATTLGRHFSAGYYGVDLFFVVSGFLITSILLNSKEPFFESYKKFLGRRTLRIFPLYYLVIVFLYLCNHEFVHKYLFNFITYTYNYAWVAYTIPNNSAAPYWSLCVEEQFYIFWPPLVLLLRKQIKVLTGLILLLVVLCFLQQTFQLIEFLNPYRIVGLIPRAGSLGLGALGSVLFSQNKFHSILKNIYVEYILLAVLLFSLVTNYSIKYPLLGICSLFLVLKAARNSFQIKKINSFLLNSKILFIGSISYGIYIIHMPLEDYFTKNIFNPIWFKINFNSFGKLSFLQYNSWIIKFPLYSALSIFLAHLSFKYFERPILRFKDKWFLYK